MRKGGDPASGGEDGAYPDADGPDIMELAFLERLYRAAGPVASVYLDTTRTTENSAHEIELRWRGQREQLAEKGADEETLKALDSAAGGAKGIPGPQGEALFAARGELLAAYTLSRPPATDRASWWPVADPIELVADLDEGVPYVVVATDRVGADVYAYPAHGDLVGERHFNGATLHINKVPSGGWRQKHQQYHTEEVWFSNAAEVARDVEDAVDMVSASLVFIGGDERARGKLQEHLSERTKELVIELDRGGRGDHDAMEELRRAVDDGLRETAEALRSGRVLDFISDVNREGRAVEGLGDTVSALRLGQVDRLLLNEDRRGEPLLWASRTDPLELAQDRYELTDPTEAIEAPASALMLRAAQSTDSAFTLLPGSDEAEDSTGALLRFSLSP